MGAPSLLLLSLLAARGAGVQRAPPLADAGPVFGLRAGLAVPSGDVARGGPEVADLVDRKIPLGLQLGYRLGRRVWAQLQLELAPATADAGRCAPGVACTASDGRFGVEVLLRLLPGARVDPWLGAGVGIEVLNVDGRDPSSGAKGEWSFTGVELPFVEAGADVALGDRIGIGPWGALSFSRFTSESARVGAGATVSGAIHGRSVHRWLAGGIQATLKL